ncbi:hypothetical protein CcaverHIS002_0210450 [Cutaneotrichosporon cavernicola]|uniref:Uncharacterized protein n=1 Tax=Cutaneotrichosporon cavernicola TaxID=279322 RepID=A0AA48I4V5_9TREE|nr:uncharacterized protein CcaverHIS019_0210460 [Cutaneotrichosporon cavernicola]BEI81885.1 hypothetical protein CcaverHIS002_0210450 [Cutaneotrichosporon cavernicola]BEI89684.1 hypothetical protein CcaverHIS019_0210460 [Cutaneotrichosporon cavernicola]BEJ05233.1 hypothetical protein CcaverHIS641_0210500 [Cutaneotrichosporon cavernicola]
MGGSHGDVQHDPKFTITRAQHLNNIFIDEYNKLKEENESAQGQLDNALKALKVKRDLLSDLTRSRRHIQKLKAEKVILEKQRDGFQEKADRLGLTERQRDGIPAELAATTKERDDLQMQLAAIKKECDELQVENDLLATNVANQFSPTYNGFEVLLNSNDHLDSDGQQVEDNGKPKSEEGDHGHRVAAHEEDQPADERYSTSRP